MIVDILVDIYTSTKCNTRPHSTANTLLAAVPGQRSTVYIESLTQTTEPK